MSNLIVKIDRVKQKAEFSGPGTYSAKEKIKEIGPSRWLSGSRVWEVSSFTLSRQQLLEHFPDILVYEDEQSSEGATVERSPTGSIEQTSSLPPSMSVSEFVAAARNALKAAFPGTVFVRGVLTLVKRAPGGRVYMELSEAEHLDEAVRVVIWRDEEKLCRGLVAAGFILESDLEVMFEVSVDLNPKKAQISLVVVGVVAEYTLGKLAAQREKTNEQLRKEGLFEMNRQRCLPFLPQKLAILTSAGGTVINDFVASLEEARFGFQLYWYQVNVQGKEAKPRLLEGIRRLSEITGIDALLIFRGGGSPADLAVFNDCELARAVCLCPFPVFSAIGHQEDQCSVQDVSYRAFGVPKDLGRFFADIVITYRRQLSERLQLVTANAQIKFAEALRGISSASSLIDRLVARAFVAAEESVQRFGTSFPLLAVTLIENRRQRILDVSVPLGSLARTSALRQEDRLTAAGRRMAAASVSLFQRNVERFIALGRLVASGANGCLASSLRVLVFFESLPLHALGALVRGEERVESLQRELEGADPQVQLRRGFALVRRSDETRYVLSGAALGRGDIVEIEFSDVSRCAEIKDEGGRRDE